MDVAVRELKARLSAYLQQAAAGQVITVTDRGRPIATLGPLIGRLDLDSAVAQGWLTPATQGALGPITPRVAHRKVLDVLAEDRGE